MSTYIAKIVSDRLDELGTTPFTVENEKSLPPDAIRNVLRSSKSGPTLNRVHEICAALDLEIYIGPKRPQEDLQGFAEDAISRIEPSLNGNPEALRQGYLPLPFNRDDTHRGASPLALARAWLLDRGLNPSKLSVVTVPNDDMEPALSIGELLVVDEQRMVTDEPALSAFVVDGRFGVGWVVAPTKDAVAILFERRYASPIILKGKARFRHRHLGVIAARFDSLPRPWLSAQGKRAILEQVQTMLSG